jgi:hypothetical protein
LTLYDSKMTKAGVEKLMKAAPDMDINSGFDFESDN